MDDDEAGGGFRVAGVDGVEPAQFIDARVPNEVLEWNDLLIPLIFMQSDEKMTVTVGVATVVGRRSTDYPLLLTGLLFSSIPPILVYLVLQRSIRRGLVIGAVR